MSQLKIRNGANWVDIPAGGVGVPSGGTTGQVLTKSSGTDYATEWALPLSMKLLWTNPSPSSDFAGQTIQVSEATGYDMYLVLARTHKSANNASINLFIMPNSSNNELWCFNAVKFHGRTSISHTDGEFTFGDGKTFTSYGSTAGTIENAYLIPYYIYGIKGVQTS